MNKYGGNNKEIIILVVIIIVLLLVAGVLTHLNPQEKNLANDIESTSSNQNTTNSENITDNTTDENIPDVQKTTLSGIYVFSFEPENVLEEDLTPYYAGVEFRFKEDNTFTAYFVEGFFITGTYLITDNILTCTTEYFTGQHFSLKEVSDVIYTFEIKDNNSIELTEKTGSLIFTDTDGIEKLLATEHYDEIGSTFVYSETSVNIIPPDDTTSTNTTNTNTITNDNSNITIDSNTTSLN